MVEDEERDEPCSMTLLVKQLNERVRFINEFYQDEEVKDDK